VIVPLVASDDELEFEAEFIGKDEAALSDEVGELQEIQKNMMRMKETARQKLYFFILFISFSFSRYDIKKIYTGQYF
jgi:hypothetical protein